ncbi:MAG: OadG family protein [Pirellulales bacterium]|nr:OadG family protein [Pirellulales bacterium]
MKADEQGSLDEALARLQADLARLGERVAALEAQTPQRAAAAPPKLGPGVSDELLSVISAAIAAYLGVKPHIRQIRLIGGTSWAQQGRVTIQASHLLPVRHG